jgi:hypothetical protein
MSPYCGVLAIAAFGLATTFAALIDALAGNEPTRTKKGTAKSNSRFMA